MAYDLNALIPGSSAAKVLGVSKQLIRRWRQLGHITPVRMDGRSPLYRLGDLFEAERKLRQSPLCRRPAILDARRASQAA